MSRGSKTESLTMLFHPVEEVVSALAEYLCKGTFKRRKPAHQIWLLSELISATSNASSIAHQL